MSTFSDQRPEPDCRVQVFAFGGTHEVGYGTIVDIVRVEDILHEPIAPYLWISGVPEPTGSAEEEKILEALATQIFENEMTEKIQLDTGEIVYGCICEWRHVNGPIH